MSELTTQLLHTGQWLLIAYVVVFLLFIMLSDFSIYVPPRPTTFVESETTHTIQVGDKAIKATYLQAPNSEFVFLYSHGNAEDLGFIEPYLKAFQANGMSIFAYDYQGYGLSEGRPSEHNTYADIEAAYQYLTQELKVPSEKIIAFGRSLGGGPTCELAVNHPLAGVVLEATFTTAFRVITHVPIFPYDKYNNLKKIDKINAPLLVIHGDEDSLISDYHGRKLFAKAKEPKMAYWIEQADHNDILQVAGDMYWQKLKEFVEFVKKHQAPSKLAADVRATYSHDVIGMVRQ